MLKKIPEDERNLRNLCFIVVMLLTMLMAVAGCGGSDSSDKAESQEPVAADTEEIAEDPVESQKEAISEMDVNQTINYINELSETGCYLEYEDGAPWLKAPNGNGVNLNLTVLVHKKFTEDEEDYHRYYFALKQLPERAAFDMVVPEEDHPFMLHALKHLQELVTE